MKTYVSLIMNSWMGANQRGEANGYVVLPVDHPFYGYHYDFVDSYVGVHGGLTYSGAQLDGHDGWAYGFDTAHMGDTAEKWPVDAVYEEAMQLLKQFNDLGEKHTADEIADAYSSWYGSRNDYYEEDTPDYNSAGFTEEDRYKDERRYDESL